MRPNVVTRWQRKTPEAVPKCSSTTAEKKRKIRRRSKESLMRQIGELNVENDFLREEYEAFLDGRL